MPGRFLFALYWLHLHILQEVLNKQCFCFVLVLDNKHDLSLKLPILLEDTHQHVDITFGRLFPQPLFKLTVIVLIKDQRFEIDDRVLYADSPILKYFIILNQGSLQG